jgi:hypothetical protein
MNMNASVSVQAAKSTQHQRGEIVRLMRRAELDTKRITLMHRRLGVPDQFLDRPIDEWMSSLSLDAANGVIKTLQDMTA